MSRTVSMPTLTTAPIDSVARRSLVNVTVQCATAVFMVCLALEAWGSLSERSGVEPTYGALRALGWISLIFLVCVLMYFRRSSGGVVNPFSIFFVSLVLFTQGQVMLMGLGISEFKVLDVRDYFSVSELYIASLFTQICVAGFFIGGLASEHGNIRQDRSVVDKVDDTNSADRVYSNISTWGRRILWITLLPFLAHQALILSSAQSVGYGAVTNADDYANTWLVKGLAVTTTYFRVAVFMVLVGFKNHPRRFTTVALLFAVHPLSLLLVGERTESTAMLLLLLWLRQRIFGMATTRSYVLTAVGAILLLLSYPAILYARHDGVVSVATIRDWVVREGLVGTIVESVANIGYSIYPLVQTMRLVPDVEPYRYGLTYVAALTTIVPFMGFARKHSALGSWLKDELHMSYGPGFSMPAEAYINFGWLGLPILVVSGYALHRVLTIRGDARKRAIMIVVSLVVLLTNVTLPRREFLGAVRDIVYVLLPIVFLITHRPPVRKYRR